LHVCHYQNQWHFEKIGNFQLKLGWGKKIWFVRENLYHGRKEKCNTVGRTKKKRRTKKTRRTKKQNTPDKKKKHARQKKHAGQKKKHAGQKKTRREHVFKVCLHIRLFVRHTVFRK
jgi:hypothetical protein